MSSLYSRKNEYGFSGFITAQSQGAVIEKSFCKKLTSVKYNYSIYNDAKEEIHDVDYNNPQELLTVDTEFDYCIDDEITYDGEGFYENSDFLIACSKNKIRAGDIFYKPNGDNTKLSDVAYAEVITVNYANNIIWVNEKTSNGFEQKKYNLDEFLALTGFNGYIDNHELSQDEKEEIKIKYKKKWLENAGIPLINGILSYGISWLGPNGAIIKEYLLKIGIDLSTNGLVDMVNGYINYSVDTDPNKKLIDYMPSHSISDVKAEIGESSYSIAIWMALDYKQEILPEGIKAKYNTDGRYGEYETPDFEKGGNALLTGIVTATLDFSSSAAAGKRDANNLEPQYAKQYKKAKMTSDLDENIFDTIGAAVLDYFLPGFGSWVGGPILNAIYEGSFDYQEYLCEVNGDPVPGRLLDGYDDFIRRRSAIVSLNNTALELYKSKCETCAEGSVERKNAKIDFIVDSNGYGSPQGVCALATSTYNDSEIDIKYSKNGQNNEFGYSEDGLSSYEYIKWVIHNGGFKIDDEVLNKNDSINISANGGTEFGIQKNKGSISSGDIMYFDSDGDGKIGPNDTCYIVTNFSNNKITLIGQTENGTEQQEFDLSSFNSYSEFLVKAGVNSFIDMSNYYDDIDKNVDYSRKDIQEIINFVKQMENNDS